MSHFKQIYDFFVELVESFLKEFYQDIDIYDFKITDSFIEIYIYRDTYRITFIENDNILITTNDGTIKLNKNDKLFTNALMILIVAKNYVTCKNYETKLKK